MRFGMKGFLRRMWAMRGSRPSVIRQNGFTSAYIFGAVNPQNGDRLGLVIDGADTEVMNLYLDMLSNHLSANVHAVIIMDGCGYHMHSDDLEIPANMTVLELPPYSPELNVIERMWNWLKNHYLCHCVYRDIQEIFQTGVEAWGRATAEIIKSLCASKWLSCLSN